MANTNRFLGLHNGPIDHQATSAIDAISTEAIDMGSVVLTSFTIDPRETLPRVLVFGSQGNSRVYGIAVAGENDGVYGDGTASTDDSTRATTGAGQRIVIVTQGRCPARVRGGLSGVDIGDQLMQSTEDGVLTLAFPGDTVIARALHPVGPGDLDIIAVTVQREGQRP